MGLLALRQSERERERDKLMPSPVLCSIKIIYVLHVDLYMSGVAASMLLKGVLNPGPGTSVRSTLLRETIVQVKSLDLDILLLLLLY